MASIRVIALISAYNEEDVIGQVLEHLVAQGVEVYLIDHASSDGTVAEAQRHLGKGLLKIERYPEESGFPEEEAGQFTWANLLRRKEQLSQELDANWFLHHDADELRESPWDSVGLAEAIGRVDALGYNAIDFKALDFVPTHNRYRKGDDLRTSFTHYRPAAAYDRLRINGWKKRTSGSADISTSGGHTALFPERRVFPVRFLLRHYPIRGQSHGERKVLRERLPRYSSAERAEGWHVQYNGMSEATSFVGAPEQLETFDLGIERARLLVENRDLEILKLGGNRPPLEDGDLAWFWAHWPRREQELVDTTRALEATSAELMRARKSTAGLQTRIDDQREERVTAVQAQCEQLERQVEALQGRVAGLTTSMSWKTTAPLRFILRQLRGY